MAYSGVLATLCIQIQARVPDPCDALGSLPTELQIGSLAVTIKDQMEGMVIDSDLNLHRRVNMMIRNNACVNATYGFRPDVSDRDHEALPFKIPGIHAYATTGSHSVKPVHASVGHLGPPGPQGNKTTHMRTMAKNVHPHNAGTQEEQG